MGGPKWPQAWATQTPGEGEPLGIGGRLPEPHPGAQLPGCKPLAPWKLEEERARGSAGPPAPSSQARDRGGAPRAAAAAEPRPGGRAGKINKRGLMAAVITAVIMAFIRLPNESHHRQREKLSIARALMNFFANCNQARPSQLAD